MALTNVAVVTGTSVKAPIGPVFVDRITLDLDDSYPSGGYASFSDTIKDVLGQGSSRTLVAVQQASPAGGYILHWDRSNDKLIIYYGNNDAGADGPLIENATADLSLITGVELLVFSF